MKNREYKISGADITSIADTIRKEMAPVYDYTANTEETYFFVLEKFSFIQSSDMSVIVVLDETSKTESDVTLIVTGGKVGLMRLDILSRETSVMEKIENELQELCDSKKWKLEIIPKD